MSWDVDRISLGPLAGGGIWAHSWLGWEKPSSCFPVPEHLVKVDHFVKLWPVLTSPVIAYVTTQIEARSIGTLYEGINNCKSRSLKATNIFTNTLHSAWIWLTTTINTNFLGLLHGCSKGLSLMWTAPNISASSDPSDVPPSLEWTHNHFAVCFSIFTCKLSH